MRRSSPRWRLCAMDHLQGRAAPLHANSRVDGKTSTNPVSALEHLRRAFALKARVDSAYHGRKGSSGAETSGRRASTNRRVAPVTQRCCWARSYTPKEQKKRDFVPAQLHRHYHKKCKGETRGGRKRVHPAKAGERRQNRSSIHSQRWALLPASTTLTTPAAPSSAPR